MLFESNSELNLQYSRQSIVIPNVALRIQGKNEDFRIEALSDTGKQIINYFDKDDFFIKGEDGRPQRIHPRKAEELGLSENNMLRMKRKIQGRRY
jgi:hypothetical protein